MGCGQAGEAEILAKNLTTLRKCSDDLVECRKKLHGGRLDSFMNQRGAVNYWYFIGMVVLAVVMVTFLQVVMKQKPTTVSMDLKVHKSGRYLERADGRSFFWQGEPSPDLSKLSRDYLKTRKEAGVSVLIGPWLGALDDSQSEAFLGGDPTRPNENWFKELDRVARDAEELDLYVAPVVLGESFRNGLYDVESARSCGKILGERYRERSNIVWIVAKDYDSYGQSQYKIFNALAEGIREGNGGRQLMTLWPSKTGTPGTFWQGVPWVAFNIVETPDSSVPVWMLAEMDYMRQPAKPIVVSLSPLAGKTHVLSIAPSGEVPGKKRDPDLEWRKNAYRSLFAGAMGLISGPGGNEGQRRQLRNLIESRPISQRIPDNRLLESEAFLYDGTRFQAAADIMGSYAFVYVPHSSWKVKVRLDRMFSKKIKAWWFNPRDGAAAAIGEYEKLEVTEFTCPPEGPDWVLVLDDAVKNYPPPGQPVVEKAAKVP